MLEEILSRQGFVVVDILEVNDANGGVAGVQSDDCVGGDYDRFICCVGEGDSHSLERVDLYQLVLRCDAGDILWEGRSGEALLSYADIIKLSLLGSFEVSECVEGLVGWDSESFPCRYSDWGGFIRIRVWCEVDPFASK